MQLAADFAGRPLARVDVGVGRAVSGWPPRFRRRRPARCPGPIAGGTAAGPMIRSGVMTPVISAGPTGQAWVPAGPFPALVHRKKLTPPLTLIWPKCTWDCVHVAFERVVAELPGDGVRLGVDQRAEAALGRGGCAGTSWKPTSSALTTNLRTLAVAVIDRRRRCHQTTRAEHRGGDAGEPGIQYSTAHIFPLGLWFGPVRRPALRLPMSPCDQRRRDPNVRTCLVYPMLALVVLTFGVA